ncbi:MAG: hypothetical protein ABIZ91_01060 [Gemmatimonadaceae bacterium]
MSIDFLTIGSAPYRSSSLSPTIAPLGSERMIRVCYVHSGEVVVRGGATGVPYHFGAGESREIPLADARILVATGDFAFSAGR